MLVRTLVLQPERPISSEWFVWFLEANGIHGKEGRGGSTYPYKLLKKNFCGSRFRRRLELAKAYVNPLEPACDVASSIFHLVIKSFFLLNL